MKKSGCITSARILPSKVAPTGPVGEGTHKDPRSPNVAARAERPYLYRCSRALNLPRKVAPTGPVGEWAHKDPRSPNKAARAERPYLSPDLL